VSDDNKMKDPHPHAGAAGAPGASGPGDPGYDGDVQLGDEGADTDDTSTPAEAEADATEGQAPTG
jgi:hypothetical protein